MGDVRDYREEFSRPFHITLPSDQCAFEHEFKQFFNLRMAIETLREIPMALFTAELVRAAKARKRSDKIYHKFRYNELWRLSAQKFSTNIKIPWLITFGFIFIVIDDLTYFFSSWESARQRKDFISSQMWRWEFSLFLEMKNGENPFAMVILSYFEWIKIAFSMHWMKTVSKTQTFISVQSEQCKFRIVFLWFKLATFISGANPRISWIVRASTKQHIRSLPWMRRLFSFNSIWYSSDACSLCV